MPAINDIVTKFSFVGSLAPQENFNGNLNASIGLLAGFSAAVFGVATAFTTWTSSTTEAIDPLVNIRNETDVTVSALQELGFAASQNGSDVSAITSSILELNKRAGEFSRTGGGTASEAFIQLGVNVKDANGNMKVADDLLLELGGSLQKFDKAEQADLLDKLGIDGSLIQLLGQSSSEIDKLRKQAQGLGTLTKEQADAANSLNDSNTILKFGLQGLKNEIAVGLAPVIENISGGFIGFLEDNKELIKNGIEKTGKAIIAITESIVRMTPVILGASAAFGVWKIATVGLSAAMGVLLSPVVLITAGIAAAILVVDDLIVAFQGGNSVIRELIKEWAGFDITPALKLAVEDFKAFIKSVSEIVSAITGLFSGIFSGLSDIWKGDFNGGLDNIMESVGEYVDRIKNIFKNMFSGIGKTIKGLIPDLFKGDEEVEVKVNKTEEEKTEQKNKRNRRNRQRFFSGDVSTSNSEVSNTENNTTNTESNTNQDNSTVSNDVLNTDNSVSNSEQINNESVLNDFSSKEILNQNSTDTNESLIDQSSIDNSTVNSILNDFSAKEILTNNFSNDNTSNENTFNQSTNSSESVLNDFSAKEILTNNFSNDNTSNENTFNQSTNSSESVLNDFSAKEILTPVVLPVELKVKIDEPKKNEIGFKGGNNGAVDRSVNSSVNQSSNVEQNNTITVYSSDANATGESIANANAKIFRDTKYNYQRGGDIA